MRKIAFIPQLINKFGFKDEITLLAQDTNHSMKDELERTVDALEKEVKEEING